MATRDNFLPYRVGVALGSINQRYQTTNSSHGARTYVAFTLLRRMATVSTPAIAAPIRNQCSLLNLCSLLTFLSSLCLSGLSVAYIKFIRAVNDCCDYFDWLETKGFLYWGLT